MENHRKQSAALKTSTAEVANVRPSETVETSTPAVSSVPVTHPPFSASTILPLETTAAETVQGEPALEILESSVIPSNSAPSVSSVVTPTTVIVSIRPLTTRLPFRTSTVRQSTVFLDDIQVLEPNITDEYNDVKVVVSDVVSTAVLVPAVNVSSSPSTPAPKKGSPVMHTLEDILQRLVPAKDDSLNPFLVNPSVPAGSASKNGGSASHPFNRPAQSDVTRGSNSSNNSSNNQTTDWTDPSESKTAATTSVYIVGVVAIVPLAGLILWIVRVQVHKRRQVTIALITGHFPFRNRRTSK